MDQEFIKTWLSVRNLSPQSCTPAHREQLYQDYEYCIQNNIHWMHHEDAQFPPGLFQGGLRLKAFFYQGQTCWKSGQCISVVGSRNASQQSLAWMDEHLVPFIQENPVVVVSGGARGIDQRAHGCALRAAKPTIAFLPSGLKSVYPKEFAQWIPKIVEGGGAVISGFPLGASMYKSFFHRRNHWMAQISAFTFMVEGRTRSGSYLTTKKALELGRDVCALSQNVNSHSRGFIQVYRNNGTLIFDKLDLQAMFHQSKTKLPLDERV